MIGRVYSQNEFRFLISNGLCGALIGGAGAVINKDKQSKWLPVFRRGFFTGLLGGVTMYGGKNLTNMIVEYHEPGYAWLSRAVYSAGNSIVENAAARRKFWKRWHYDFAFLRIEANLENETVLPRIMPSMLGAFIFTAIYGSPDLENTFRTGTFVFRTTKIRYAPELGGSTTGNFFLVTDSMRHGDLLNDFAAHELIHTFQFADFTAVNNYFSKLRSKHQFGVKPWCKFIYGDLNYEIMLLNYFVIQGGFDSKNYKGNFLEQEAEYLANHKLPRLKFGN